MKKLFFFVPVFLFLASCVKNEPLPIPQKAMITEVKLVKFPSTDGSQVWDPNGTGSATAPDVYFAITNTNIEKTLLKSRNTVPIKDNVTLKELPGWPLNPKFELKTLYDKISFDFYDQDSGFAGDDDSMGSCILDMTKETDSGSIYPKTITIDNGLGLSATFTIEYIY